MKKLTLSLCVILLIACKGRVAVTIKPNEKVEDALKEKPDTSRVKLIKEYNIDGHVLYIIEVDNIEYLTDDSMDHFQVL